MYRGCIKLYRTHNCPTLPEDVDDMDLLIQVAEDDERKNVSVSCFRAIVEQLMRKRDCGNDSNLLYEMYRLMVHLNSVMEVQIIGIDALIVLCVADEWKEAVTRDCNGLDQYLEELSADASFALRVANLRSLLKEFCALRALRELETGDGQQGEKRGYLQ